MDNYQQLIKKLHLVLVGDFNPSIVTPWWLATKKLIPDIEAESAEVEIIHKGIAQFSIGWAIFEVTTDRFEVKVSEESYFEPLKDLVTGIFQILKETPVKGVGINHLNYFSLKNQDKMYEFGNKIAPLNLWDNIINEPRLINLEIFEQTRKDNKDGQYRLRITPSDILSIPFGVLMSINDHFNIKSKNVSDVISDNWNDSFKRATESINHIDENLLN